jgi:long-chain acyl-CoA synthetase
MIVGSRLVLMYKFDPEAMLALIERERATHFVGVPTIPHVLLAHPGHESYDLSSMLMMTYGGASPPRDLGQRLARMWPRMVTGVGWGMTETCATFTHQLAEDYAHRPDSCGPAIPVGDMKIVDAEGNGLPAGQVGELWVFGPSIVRGYWNKPDRTASSFQDGWLKTGDLARLDEEGFCYIVDRLKDVVVRGGEKIYSVEVEAALLTHASVMEAAVVAIPHPSLGEVPGAIVSIRPGTAITVEELRAHVSEHLAPYKVPVGVLLWSDPLPRNAAGKLLKRELRRLFDALIQE